MAQSFKDQFEGLTNLTVDTDIPAVDLQDFLEQGVKDVVTRVRQFDPSSVMLFTKRSSYAGLNSKYYNVNDNKDVVSLERYFGTTVGFENSSPIPHTMKNRALNSSSMHYAGKRDPVHWVMNGVIDVAPEYSSSEQVWIDDESVECATSNIGGKLAFTFKSASSLPTNPKIGDTINASNFTGGTGSSDVNTDHIIKALGTSITESGDYITPGTASSVIITETPIGSISGPANAALAPNALSHYASRLSTIHYGTINSFDSAPSSIDNFPEEYYRAVVFYSCILGCQSMMTKCRTNLPVDSEYDTYVIAPVAPLTPDAPSFSFGTLSKDAVDTTNIEISFSDIVAPLFNPPKIDNSLIDGAWSTATLADNASLENFSTWFSALGKMIEGSEDTELAAAQIQKISTALQQYNMQLSTNIAEFNQHVEAYKHDVTRKIQNASNNLNMALSNAKSENEFRLQQKLNDYKATLEDYMQTIEKYKADLTGYQSETMQLVEDYKSKLAIVKTKFEKYTLEYQWYMNQSETFKQDYLGCFPIGMDMKQPEKDRK